ncbi:MAG: zinc ribbon domain-containing protein [Verrucomicrobiae bacterium]|nr:zinc ribbon domain-containing protein [Verrucomicrobiae bacterium]
MPTYDYVCEKCNHEFEFFQSMSDPRLTDCPVEGCGGHVKRKIGTGAGIIFKGSGFYETDYRSESYKSGAKKESDAGEAKPKADTAAASTSTTSSDSGGAKKASGGEKKTSSSGSSTSTSSSSS